MAINEPGSDKVHVQTSLKGRTLASFQIVKYGNLFPALKELGFAIFGTTFVTDIRQLEGLRAPEFRTAGLLRGWPVWETMQKWRQIAALAGRRNEMRLMDVAARVAAGLEYSEMRLYDLAESYSNQLHGHLNNDDAKTYPRFKDTISPGVYKNIHALFWEMAVLRDVLAEFIAVFCVTCGKVTTLSRLRKALKNNPSAEPIADEILRISDTSCPGWLATFGSYRDCFTHSAPLEQAAGIAWAVQDQLILTNGTVMPQIYFALPQDAEALSRKRTAGPLFSSFRDMAVASSSKRDRTIEPDALQYLHTCLCQLTDLASRLTIRSPIAPQPMVISREDIVGEITVTRG